MDECDSSPFADFYQEIESDLEGLASEIANDQVHSALAKLKKQKAVEWQERHLTQQQPVEVKAHRAAKKIVHVEPTESSEPKQEKVVVQKPLKAESVKEEVKETKVKSEIAKSIWKTPIDFSTKGKLQETKPKPAPV